jgi:hypothetical protein
MSEAAMSWSAQSGAAEQQPNAWRRIDGGGHGSPYWECDVVHACCGGTMRHTSTVPPPDGNWAARTAKLAADDCTSCKHRASAERAARGNGEIGLPTLVGSPKQITWAEQIRAQAIASRDNLVSPVAAVRGACKALVPRMAEAIGAAEAASADIRTNTSAKWWIDNRERTDSLVPDAMIRSFTRAFEDELKAAVQANLAAQAQARREADRIAQAAARAGKANQRAPQQAADSNVVPFRPRSAGSEHATA